MTVHLILPQEVDMPADPAAPTPLSLLREVVEAALDVAILRTSEGRDAVLALLRPQLASAIPRMSTTRMDVMSALSTVLRYEGGLDELMEAIRFYAADSIAMTRLDAAITRADL